MGFATTSKSNAITPIRRKGSKAALFAAALMMAPMTLPSPAQARGPESLADLAESVSDAVVNISAAQTGPAPRGNAAPTPPQGTPFDDLFEEFFRRRQGEGGGAAPNTPPQQRRGGNSLGSGFVIDSAGIVITNAHVIADSNEITVIFTDGQQVSHAVKLSAGHIESGMAVNVHRLKKRSGRAGSFERGGLVLPPGRRPAGWE